MNRNALVDEVIRRTGEPPAQVGRYVDLAVAHVGRCLTPKAAHLLAKGLPEGLSERLDATLASDEPETADKLIRRFADETGLRTGLAMEHLQVVCQVLGEGLDPDLRDRLCRELHASVADLFQPKFLETDSGITRERLKPIGPPGGRTVATGRPGSRHPISDSAPVDAHRESVARSDDPHADRKLSEAEDVGPDGGTLSTGKPGSSRPISEPPED